MSARDLPYVLPLAAVDRRDLAAVGGKGANLGELCRAGLPVPQGFCVTTRAFSEFVRTVAGYGDLIAALGQLASGDAEGARALGARLRALLTAAPVPAPIAAAVAQAYAELGEGAAVAVRSSATAEDLPQASFAGQQETFLDVVGRDAVVAQTRACWASLFTDRAIVYRAQNGFDHGQVALAVVVQRMVPADAAGVLFTADPVSGRRDRMVIEAAPGLGEALVAGRVSPHRLLLARPGLDVSERQPATPILSDPQARALGELAGRAQAALGGELDIEWAVAAGAHWLLQARPITALPAEPSLEDRQIWTNANTGEIVPDVVTPMTWSILEPLVRRMVGTVVETLGVDISTLPLVGLVAGRPYFSATALAAVMRRVFFLRRATIAEVFGGQQEAADALGAIRFDERDLPPVDFSLLRLLRRMPAFFCSLLFFSVARARRVVERLRRRADQVAERARQQVSDAELVALLRDTGRALSLDGDAFELQGAALILPTLVYKTCSKHFGDAGNALASRLMSGLSQTETAEAAQALWRLAQRAHQAPAVAAALQGAASFAELRTALDGLEGGAAFMAAWDAFMQAHGHHCRAEVELMTPRWREQPDRLLQQVRSYVEAGAQHDLEAQAARYARTRAEAEQELRGRLRGPIERWWALFALRRARAAAPFRENIKSQQVRVLAALRLVLLELGERLARQGRLRRRDDIFFLEEAELGQALSAEPGTLLALVAERRAEHARNSALEPPAVVRGRFDPSMCRPAKLDAAARELRGIACNPGVVTGPARVILRAGDDQVAPGEVLVAPFTDPGWTPYFINAAAIVMDLGGVLSHGSIVARELGIPAVVNVGTATRVIRTGQTLRVDGGRGVVEILD